MKGNTIVFYCCCTEFWRECWISEIRTQWTFIEICSAKSKSELFMTTLIKVDLFRIRLIIRSRIIIVHVNIVTQFMVVWIPCITEASGWGITENGKVLLHWFQSPGCQWCCPKQSQSQTRSRRPSSSSAKQQLKIISCCLCSNMFRAAPSQVPTSGPKAMIFRIHSRENRVVNTMLRFFNITS